MKKVVLIVDNPLRDLHGLVLVAMELVNRDITCFLVPANLRDAEPFKIGPDFVLLNYIRNNNADLIRKLQACDIPYGVLDTEGGLLRSWEAYGTMVPDDRSLLSKASLFASWGTELADFLIDKGYYSSHQIKITGAPKLDFYHSSLSGIFKPYPFDKPIILINSNFPDINPEYQSPKLERESNLKVIDIERDEYVRLENNRKEGFIEFIKIPNSLARKYPDKHIVYRPHPYERLQTYESLLLDLPNLHVIKEGHVAPWIFNSKVVIQRSCSTSFEAGIANIPTLSPKWVKTTELPQTEEISIPCHSFENLCQYLEDAFNGKDIIPDDIRQKLDEVTHDSFYKVDGKSYQRVAEAILHHLSDNQTEIKENCLSELGTTNYRESLTTRTLILRSIKSALGLHEGFSFKRMKQLPEENAPAWLDPWKKSGKYFDVDEVRKIARDIAGIANGKPSFAEMEISLTKAHGMYLSDNYNGFSVMISPKHTV